MTATLSPDERDALVRQFERLAREAPLDLLTERRLQELTAIESDGATVVSLYLDLSPQYRLKRGWETAFKSMARRALDGIEDRAQAGRLREELDRVQGSLIERLPDLGRGVALFVCEPLGLWHEVALPLPLPNRLELGPRPFLRPLVWVRDEHDRFVVALLDRRRARLFVSHLGFVQQAADLVEASPDRATDVWSQVRLQRHQAARVLWHAGAVAHATVLLMQELEARHLLVSGTAEVVAEYRQHLSPAAAQALRGEFSVPIEATPAEVAEAVAPLQREVEAREEVATVHTLAEAAPAGRGVWGLEGALLALSEQRVLTFVVDHEYRAAGARCPHCRLLVAGSEAECPSCARPLEAVEDVVELALEHALNQSAILELVRSDAARALLREHAPVGAVLRF